MQTVADGLLADILANPEDDTPRLIYADLLDEEAGGYSARAELIRVQIALTDLCCQCVDQYSECRRCRTWRREQELWHRLQFGDLCPAAFEGWFSIRINPNDRPLPLPCGIIRRGFVEAITCTCADWLAHGPAIVRVQPVREVRLSDKQLLELRVPLGSSPRWFWMTVSPAREERRTDFSRSRTGLPLPLYDWLPTVARRKGWRTEHGAWVALSRAALAWARAEEVPCG